MTHLKISLLEHQLREEIKKMKAGTMLPSDAQLARHLKISPSSIKRMLVRLEKENAVERVAGKGTFAGHAPKTPWKAIPAVRRAAERVADNLYELICRGKWKAGETLPAVKFCSIQFRTTPATIIAAYRILIRRGLVTHSGRKYLAGGLESQFFNKSGKKVVFFPVESNLLEIYSTNEFSQAYISMEHELLRYGYCVDYENYSSLPELMRTWARTSVPHGIIAVSPNNDAIRDILDTYKKISKRFFGYRIPAAIVGGNISEKPPSDCAVISYGNTYTTLARVLARYLCGRNHGTTALYLDAAADGQIWAMRYLKVISEIRNINRRFPITMIVNFEFQMTTGVFREWILQEYSEERLLSIMGKYAPQSFVEIADRYCRFVSSRDRALELIDSESTWVFRRDTDAAAALDWCANRSRRVPEDCEIIGLENNPEYYSHGISACVRDLQTMGFLMAHAIIGDFPVEKSTRGYMHVPALMLERRTSR